MIYELKEDIKLECNSKKIKYKIVNECFLCISHKPNARGYCYINRHKKQWRLHRYVYEIYYGSIPKGLVIRHKCDNPLCINPNHLELGTPADNSNDMVKRNRSAKGEKVNTSKLNASQVKEIRKQYHKGLSKKRLSKLFNISVSNIDCVVNNRIWKHLY